VWYQLSEDPDGMLLNLEVLVLHAIEKHENIFVSVDKGVELRVQIFEHGYSDSIFLVCCCSHKEPVKQFVDDSLHA
jgi:hypothetical protein